MQFCFPTMNFPLKLHFLKYNHLSLFFQKYTPHFHMVQILYKQTYTFHFHHYSKPHQMLLITYLVLLMNTVPDYIIEI